MATLRRLYQQGNSIVISIPTYMLDDLQLKRGDQVAITTTPRPSIEIHPMKKTLTKYYGQNVHSVHPKHDNETEL